ncbi:hypothetical protein [Erythrobacter dokdonensis]|jgi:hypothetical protein|uniref:Uncharacterized protein n=1 Tax=Erythrobacter dokdonensis DSW-74 TaxID=1300349 RepID=A0A1A7BGN0_9SPHN|nr:hypothetical protein [Erythrobacter dokdonensis]OBV11649.1 hypothetical protein I603_1092 [Erythrobacter dokdonensis DSW-74]
MAQTYEFYCERADEAAALADAATLENVRERELRSEKTWRGLAEQARKTAIQREKAERERAGKRAAEAEEALARDD